MNELISQEPQYVIYDVTDCFFEIDFSDENGDRPKGVSKEHRTDLINWSKADLGDISGSSYK
ncbi:MAG: hypothetical protein SCM11_06840 [Bacillota bacterium]|nr:hypothetical protein [Bacillota bacterium]